MERTAKYIKQNQATLDEASKPAEKLVISPLKIGAVMPAAAPNRAQQTTTSTLGQYLADLRNAKGMTLRAVEEATKKEVSNPYLSQLENDKIQKPSPNILHALAQIYGASYERIMEKAGYIVSALEAKKTPGERHGRVAAFALEDFTPEEEELVLRYAAFVRSQRKKP